jgi:anti-sigma-K factor RskA
VLAWTGWAVAAGCSFFAGLQFHQRQQIQGSIAVQQARMDDMSQKAAHAQDALSTLTAANAMQVALHQAPTLKPATAVKPGTPPPVAPEALAAYLADKGALVFVATHMQPAPAGKTYELWLLPASGKDPIPAGTFKPDAQGSASVVMPQLPAGVAAKGFGVTVENDGGSSTPTLPIVMSGT